MKFLVSSGGAKKNLLFNFFFLVFFFFFFFPGATGGPKFCGGGVFSLFRGGPEPNTFPGANPDSPGRGEKKVSFNPATVFARGGNPGPFP